MNKYVLFTFLFSALLGGNTLSAAGEGVSSWIQKTVSQKMLVQKKLEKAKMPISTPVLRRGDKAVEISADVTGQKQLVLITNETTDGNGWDWSAWAGAQLTKKDGSKVWLDELKADQARSAYGIQYNKDFNGQPIKVGGKQYDRGILCHAPGIMVYNLNGEYTAFNAEVGIDNKSQAGSVIFTVSNMYPTDVAKSLTSQFPEEVSRWAGNVGGMEKWLIISGTALEDKIVSTMINKLQVKDYYNTKLAAVRALKTDEDKLEGYLSLFDQLSVTLSIQDELTWLNPEALELAYNDMSKSTSFDKTGTSKLYTKFKSLVKAGFNGIYSNEAEAVANAKEALSIKRTILLSNPLLAGDKIVAARYKLGTNARRANAPDLGTQANNWSNQESARREGFDAEIVELSNLKANRPTIRTIFHQKNGGSIADLKMHWDGDRVMYTSTQDDRRWNIFETKLENGETKPLLDIPERDLEFYDGTYLPDGNVIAISNIGYQGVPCVSGSDPVGNMMLFDAKKKEYRRITYDQDANWNPVVMNNGRIMYTRWEYTDLMHYYSRFVMHMNPDGTEQKALYGSGETFPNSTFDIQPLPGHSSAFVGIISGHHGVARSGRLIVFDPTKGRAGVEGMLQEIPYKDRKIVKVVKDYLVDGVWPQFIKPTPLDDKYFLVAAKLTPNDLWGIYLVDIFDNVTCVQKVEGEGYISPIIVRKQKTPPVIPSKVNLEDKEATVYIQDIYEGEGLRDVPRGTVKSLRIHAYEYAYLKTQSDHNWHGVQSGWDIKRQLGTVPIEEDGSAIFKIPANTPISIQPLDENGQAIQLMRSWLTGMPGEVVSCVGCHEDQNQIAMPKKVIASSRAPHKIKAPEGGVRSFTFKYEVQPVLDRACVACHNGEKSFDLRGGKQGKNGYTQSYLNLHPFVHRQGAEADMAVLQPYEYHASTSELIRILEKGHYNVKLKPEEWQALYTWIDYNAPDRGYFNANKIKNVVNQGHCQIERRTELTNKYGNGMGVDWKKEIEDYAAYLKGKGEIKAEFPEARKEKAPKQAKAKGWPLSKEDVTELLTDEKETRMSIEIAPGMKMNFVRIPAGQFVMGNNTGDRDNMPASKVAIKDGFWMAEVEVTNAQFGAFFPEHDSRYVDQLWKDHVHEGYPANLPHQPVIRVSYNQAVEFCEELSKKTGLKVTLPTEAQWEWACRAGSDSDFWYGDLNTDFGKKENLADASTLKFAVAGVDPQPMGKGSYWYDLYTYLPKEKNVNDGAMIQVDSKNYEANPFGLYSMHGNIAEWTRSHYLPYPFKENSKQTSEYRVVRGGSYIERPKFSTSYNRKYYYPHQRVHNVGFRVIIED